MASVETPVEKGEQEAFSSQWLTAILKSSSVYGLIQLKKNSESWLSPLGS